MKSTRQAGLKFQRLVGIMRSLREPGGCSWDRKQDVRSIVDYFLEEAYEAAEACLSGNPESAAEELGDLLMEIVFLARLFEERGLISISDALDGINDKMVARHPHVFGKAEALTEDEVLHKWQRRKLREKGRDSVLDGLGTKAPGLLSAFQIGQRVSACGFDWPGPHGALEKVKEEMRELEEAMERSGAEEIEEELGDLLFSLVNVSRHLRVNPELAIRKANRKFSARFRKLETRFKNAGRELGEATLEELDEVWEQIKE